MNRTFIRLVVLIGIVTLTTVGCSKKVTKIQPGETATIKITDKPDNDSFRGQELDSRAIDVFVPIYFEYDKSDILRSESQKLDKIASFLNANTSIRILIEGHCDEMGSSEYNIGLGERRARTIQQWLLNYGISDARVEITSYGKEQPAMSSCQGDDCHAQNRRAEWKVSFN